MIRSTLSVTIGCDQCFNGLTGDPAQPTGDHARFTDRRTALGALAAALTTGGWVRMFDGRLLCPPCAAWQTCTDYGHDYSPNGGPDDGRDQDGSGGWRMCACDRSLPSHADTPPDPAGGGGCGMTWRLCGRCDHIDEHHITDPPPRRPDGPPDRGRRDVVQVQPGGFLRQDVPAGLALPTHTPTHTTTSKPAISGHETSRETPMVEPIITRHGAPGAHSAGPIGGAR